MLTQVLVMEAKQTKGDTTVYAALGKEWRDMYGTQLDEMTVKIRRAVATGLQNREGVPKIRKRVQAAMGVDADTKKSRNKLTVITRSAMIDTMNEARLELVTRYPHLVGELQWVTSYDRRVCPICEKLAGKRWAPDDASRPRPVRDSHLQCRCSVIPIPNKREGVKPREKRPDYTMKSWMQDKGLGDLANELQAAGATSNRLWQGRDPAPRAARRRVTRAPAAKKPETVEDMPVDDLLAYASTADGQAMEKTVKIRSPKDARKPIWLRKGADFVRWGKRMVRRSSVSGELDKIDQQLKSPVSKLHKTLADKLFPSDRAQRQTIGAAEYEALSKRWDGWRSKLTKSEIKAFRTYSTQNYKRVNKGLRDSNATQKQKAYSAQIETDIRKGIAKAPKPPPPQVVYRFTGPGAGLQDLAIGDVQVQKGVVSTAVAPGAYSATDFMMEIVPKHGALTGHHVTSKYATDEQEFMMNHNTKLMLVGVKVVKNHIGEQQLVYQMVEVD